MSRKWKCKGNEKRNSRLGRQSTLEEFLVNNGGPSASHSRHTLPLSHSGTYVCDHGTPQYLHMRQGIMLENCAGLDIPGDYRNKVENLSTIAFFDRIASSDFVNESVIQFASNCHSPIETDILLQSSHVEATAMNSSSIKGMRILSKNGGLGGPLVAFDQSRVLIFDTTLLETDMQIKHLIHHGERQKVLKSPDIINAKVILDFASWSKPIRSFSSAIQYHEQAVDDFIKLVIDEIQLKRGVNTSQRDSSAAHSLRNIYRDRHRLLYNYFDTPRVTVNCVDSYLEDDSNSLKVLVGCSEDLHIEEMCFEKKVDEIDDAVLTADACDHEYIESEISRICHSVAGGSSTLTKDEKVHISRLLRLNPLRTSVKGDNCSNYFTGSTSLSLINHDLMTNIDCHRWAPTRRKLACLFGSCIRAFQLPCSILKSPVHSFSMDENETLPFSLVLPATPALFSNNMSRFPQRTAFNYLYDQEDAPLVEATCIASDSDSHLIVCGTSDGNLLIFDNRSQPITFSNESLSPFSNSEFDIVIRKEKCNFQQHNRPSHPRKWHFIPPIARVPVSGTDMPRIAETQNFIPCGGRGIGLIKTSLSAKKNVTKTTLKEKSRAVTSVALIPVRDAEHNDKLVMLIWTGGRGGMLRLWQVRSYSKTTLDEDTEKIHPTVVRVEPQDVLTSFATICASLKKETYDNSPFILEERHEMNQNKEISNPDIQSALRGLYTSESSDSLVETTIVRYTVDEVWSHRILSDESPGGGTCHKFSDKKEEKRSSFPESELNHITHIKSDFGGITGRNRTFLQCPTVAPVVTSVWASTPSGIIARVEVSINSRVKSNVTCTLRSLETWVSPYDTNEDISNNFRRMTSKEQNISGPQFDLFNFFRISEYSDSDRSQNSVAVWPNRNGGFLQLIQPTIHNSRRISSIDLDTDFKRSRTDSDGDLGTEEELYYKLPLLALHSKDAVTGYTRREARRDRGDIRGVKLLITPPVSTAQYGKACPKIVSPVDVTSFFSSNISSGFSSDDDSSDAEDVMNVQDILYAEVPKANQTEHNVRASEDESEIKSDERWWPVVLHHKGERADSGGVLPLGKSFGMPNSSQIPTSVLFDTMSGVILVGCSDGTIYVHCF